MTPAQLFATCALIAPNFRIGIEYPVSGRSLVWRGWATGAIAEETAGVLFPESAAFEPLYEFLLRQALTVLRQSV